MRTINIKLVLLALLIGASVYEASAQVYFKISLTPDEKTYIVSMIPEVTLETPMNIVSTSQVTLRVPADNEMVISNLRTDLSNVKWQESYVAVGPDEAPDYEYISFGLTSLASPSFPFELGREVELFRFDNEGGCPGKVSLINNQSDPFLYPNSRSVSISNGITVLGLGTQAYAGNVENGSVGCLAAKEVAPEIAELDESIVISPNPTTDYARLSYGNIEAFGNQNLMVFNLDGQMVYNSKISGEIGNHKLDVDVRDWNSGSYLMYIENDKGKTRAKRFIKVSAL